PQQCWPRFTPTQRSCRNKSLAQSCRYSSLTPMTKPSSWPILCQLPRPLTGFRNVVVSAGILCNASRPVQPPCMPPYCSQRCHRYRIMPPVREVLVVGVVMRAPDCSLNTKPTCISPPASTLCRPPTRPIRDLAAVLLTNSNNHTRPVLQPKQC